MGKDKQFATLADQAASNIIDNGVIPEEALDPSKRLIPGIEGQPITGDFLETVKFFEEELEIMLFESADVNAPNPVELGCNGEFRRVYRGVPTKLRRKFVDLLFAKKDNVTTPEIVNGSGDHTFCVKRTTHMAYPFQVLSDPSPQKSIEWQKKRMQEVV